MSEHILKIAGIVKESVVDGPGFRYVVFAQGCHHKCPGCHNPHTHPIDGGKEISVDEIFSEIIKNPLLKGVTLSGGEPFLQAVAFVCLARKVKEAGLSVMIYSGYTLEELTDMFDEFPEYEKLLDFCDILVDGRFIENEKNLTLKFRGSNNQRILDVPKSLEKNSAVLLELF